MNRVQPDNARVVMNLHRSFLIAYHRAAHTSSTQDWFKAALAAKQLDWYIRRRLSFWQRIVYMWNVVTLSDQTFKIPNLEEDQSERNI